MVEFSTASRFSLVPNGEYGCGSQSSDFYFTLASILPEFWQYLMIYSSFGFFVGFLNSHEVSSYLNYSSVCSSLCLRSGNFFTSWATVSVQKPGCMKWILWEWRHLVWNCRPYCGLEIVTFPLKRMLEHHIYLWITPILLQTPTVYTRFLLWLRFSRAFSSVVRQMPVVYLAKTGHGPHSSWFVKCVVLCIVCVDCVVYVLFVCKCVLYYCHRVATQLQLNISHLISSSSNLARTKESLLTIKSYFYKGRFNVNPINP